MNIFAIYASADSDEPFVRTLADKSDRVDQWAHRRAIIKCGQAIFDYEFDRGVDGMTAYRYAIKIMRGGA